MEKMPEMSPLALAAIAFFVIGTIMILWEIYAAPTMTDEEEALDRFFDEMYKAKKK